MVTMSEIVDVVALCLLAAILSGTAVYFYMLRSAVGKAMRNEVAKKYGERRMSKYMGMPPPEVPASIAAISPRFCRIFEQSQYAEQDGHDEVCGIGYGKGLEVLIKDYAISVAPASAEKIKRCSLAECIDKYVGDESIRNSTDLARWLRNDETHYERTLTNHGIKDLTTLITITMLLIEQAQVRREVDTKIQTMREKMNEDRSKR
jgi:hypothetical protein